MSFDRAEYICTLLLTQRVVEREQFPELEDDAELLQEVRQRLTQVGMTLIERTGIPFLAVVVRNETVTEEVANELGLDQRALALILRTWLRLTSIPALPRQQICAHPLSPKMPLRSNCNRTGRKPR